MSKKRSSQSIIRWLYRWHRRVAVAALFFVVLVSLTGIVLNHTVLLQLDRIQVKNALFLALYGRTMSDQDRPDYVSFPDGNWLAHFSGMLYGPEGPITGMESFNGAVEVDGLVVAAGRRVVLLLTPGGELLERLDWARDVLRIGRQEGRVVLETAAGIFICDPDFLDCRTETRLQQAMWAEIRKPGPEELEALKSFYRGSDLTLYRVILDAHTLRLIGPWGPWLLDLAVIALLFVSGTGFIMWFKRRGP